MRLIVQDKELTTLITNSNYHNAIYIKLDLESNFKIIKPFTYSTNTNHSLVNEVPKEIVDKIKTLLVLGVDKDNAFESIKPYVINQ